MSTAPKSPPDHLQVQQSKEKRNIEVMWCAKFQQSKPIQSQTPGQRSAGYCTKIVLALLSGAACFNLLRADSARVGNLLASPLEQRFQGAKITAPETLTGIIVLTGTRTRLSEAGQLARRYPQLQVVVSGAKEMPGVLADLGGGIEPPRVVLEMRARNTFENSLYSTDLERWLLVTGALHMPRAIGAFRMAGFDVEPWPVDDLAADNPSLADAALHEWLGLFVYWILGRTNSLFPSPASAPISIPAAVAGSTLHAATAAATTAILPGAD
jgi:uncharacterized SAM-binding protein YcdF (DUF218 family)